MVTECLSENLKALPVKNSQLEAKAVSNFEGPGHLERPDYDLSDHARYLVGGDGEISVTMIDIANVRGGDIAIKIDVEGGELNVIEGAKQTIAAADNCLIAFEAHPNVSRRTGRDPLDCLKFLESIRPFTFSIAETGHVPSSRHPILNYGQTDVWNVIAITKTKPF